MSLVSLASLALGIPVIPCVVGITGVLVSLEFFVLAQYLRALLDLHSGGKLPPLSANVSQGWI
jgi:hypothetical protein